MIGDLHFLRPLWLTALLALPLLWLWVRSRGDGGGRWRRYVAADLLPYLLARPGHEGTASRWPVVALLTGFALAVVALAGPVWRQLPQPLYRAGSALVLAVDLSASMDATDIAPSRLERARLELADLLDGRRDGETALVLFAADAFVASPLTDDARTIKALLPALATDLVPRQGSNPAVALDEAEALLTQAGHTTGHILLVCDAVTPEAIARASELARGGIRVSVMALGTAAGGPVRRPDGSLLKDADGNIVLPAMDAGPMRRLAERGDGVFVPVTLGDADVERILTAVSGASGQGASHTDLNTDVWREEGPWLLLALLPLAALAFRRGWVLGVLLLAMPMPRDAQAATWTDLWQTPDQQGQAALDAGRAEAAAQLFRDPEWRAAAQYRAGEYQASARALAGLDTARAHYNRGNALAMGGEVEAALEAYERALELEPDFEDARHNRDLLRSMPEPPAQDSGQGESDPQKGQQGQQGQQGQEGPEGQEGQQGQDEQEGPSSSGQDESASADAQGQSEASGEQPTEGQSRDEESTADGRQPESGSDGSDPTRGATGDGGSEADSAGQGDAAAEDEDLAAAQAHFSDQPSGEEADATPMTESGDAAADPSQPRAAGMTEQEREARQASEQWLRRIPEDPGGLLRRKFELQYQRQRARPKQSGDPW